MEDHFFEQQENTQPHQDGVVIEEIGTQEQNQQQEHNDEHFDDFFGGNQAQPVENNGFQQQQQQQHNYSAFDTAEQSGYDQSTQLTSNVGANVNGPDPDFFDASEATTQQLSEHEERRLRLQKEDQERTNKLIAKQNEENTQKNAKISAAKQFLASWKTTKENNIQTRKQVCLQEEEVLVQSRKTVTYVKNNQQMKNPWEKITDNISLKSSDNLGQKDVSRMKESILNKKADLANAATKN